MLKIAITGSTGLIGSRFIELLNKDFTIIPLTHDLIDITDSEQVSTQLKSIEFDLLLHLAAFTNVDAAEKEWITAQDINTNGTENLFNYCQTFNKKFIYISTDFVFDGKNSPYDEMSEPNPISNYGKSKYDGEKIVKNRAMIVRLSYPYGHPNEVKADFVQTIKHLLENKVPISMINDSIITPTFIDDIIYGLNYLISNYSNNIFHLVGNNSLSPFAAGQLIAQTFNLDAALIKPTTYKDYFLHKAQRPQYLSLIHISEPTRPY